MKSVTNLTESFFLSELSTSLISEESGNISGVAVARLRNLAAILSTSANDEIIVQTHDANLLYHHRTTVPLGARELNGLADAGLAGFSSDNMPVWYWIADRQRQNKHWLQLSTRVGSELEREGAFRAMTLLNLRVESEEGILNRQDILENWLLETTSARLRNAAISYISKCGTEHDLNLIEREVARNDSSTFRQSLEAAILMRNRLNGDLNALRFALENSFDTLGSATLDLIGNATSKLTDGEIQTALSHRSESLRLKAFQTLVSRNRALARDEAEALLSDSSLPIREAALNALRDDGVNISVEDARKHLVRKQKTTGLFGISSPSVDPEAEAAIDRFKLYFMRTQSIEMLELAASRHAHDSVVATVALAMKSPAKYCGRIRADFDDRFARRFASHMEYVRSVYDGMPNAESSINQSLKLENYLRRSWTRDAAAFLIGRNDPQDTVRIRQAIDSDAMTLSIDLVDFLARLKDWEDLQRIVKIYNEPSSLGLLAFLGRERRAGDVARALLKIAGPRFEDLVGSEFVGSLLGSIVKSASIASFKSLGADTLASLLSHKSDDVRKLTALRIVRDLNFRNAKAVFSEYSQKKERFYNVVRWLDLVEAYDSSTAKKVANRELASILSE